MQDGRLTALKRFILWDYSRGSIPYDIMVVLILAFIFLTPRALFRDQPKGSDLVMLPASHGASVFYLDPGLLAGVPEDQLQSEAQALIRRHSSGKSLRLVRIEPIFDSEEEVTGYMAFAEP